MYTPQNIDMEFDLLKPVSDLEEIVFSPEEKDKVEIKMRLKDNE